MKAQSSSGSNTTFPRRLVSIMCLDVVDYSKRIRLLDAEAHVAVRDSIKFCKSNIPSYGGNFIEGTGDGILVEFESPVRAVEAGVFLQRKLRNMDCANLEDGRLEFRIGITLGEVAFDSNKMFGTALKPCNTN